MIQPIGFTIHLSNLIVVENFTTVVVVVGDKVNVGEIVGDNVGDEVVGRNVGDEVVGDDVRHLHEQVGCTVGSDDVGSDDVEVYWSWGWLKLR